ncbi:alpha-1B-glycoprotein-like [Mus pahari]|uniref:alpha-1B-glycoprotein-like n=1 Tax=Mus pahari TaxID=10093 RepID=UPI001114EEA5|nr:alpha-1B-glycoprotein-like [Mus pahari]
MSLLATVLLLWGFTLGPATDAAACTFRDAIKNNSLPRPWLLAYPVLWITPGLRTVLFCQGRVKGAAFLLRREGDDGFLEVAETDEHSERATFRVYQPGNYSCSYQIHGECTSSKPSRIVTIKKFAKPPPPLLISSESSTVEPPHMAHMTLLCSALLNDVEFQLRQGKREMKVLTVSASPEQVSFYLKLSDMGDQSPFTCRYRLSNMTAWSEDSEPLELMWSDETLPAPVLTAEPPANQSFEPGSTVQLRS